MGQQQASGVGQKSAPDGQKTDLYRVVGPGSVFRNEKVKDSVGKERVITRTYKPNELLELTADEAASYGKAVDLADNPVEQPPAKRKAGRYKLLGPESFHREVEVDGKKQHRVYHKGDVVELSEEDARNPNLHIIAA